MTTTFKTVITALMRSDHAARLAVDGRVGCPHSTADVDIDWCYTCPALDAVYQDRDGRTWVRCDNRRR